jgi:hypothetical protein
MQNVIVRTSGVVAAALAGLIVSSSAASALVLVEKSEAQKLRADIQGQQSKYVACLVKAASNCESSGSGAASECNLNNGTATPPADAKGKFVADIGKCDAKLDFLKKAKTLTATSGYTGIGCPGDSNSGTAGDQPYADMSAWQAATPATTKSQIQTLAIALGGLSGCNTAGTGSAKDQNKCQAALVKVVAGYAAAIYKCEIACENDYKNKKGNGGGTDAAACDLNAAGTAGAGDTNFNACIGKAYTKATKTPFVPNVQTVILPALATALNDANNDVNNQDDCGP